MQSNAAEEVDTHRYSQIPLLDVPHAMLMLRVLKDVGAAMPIRNMILLAITRAKYPRRFIVYVRFLRTLDRLWRDGYVCVYRDERIGKYTTVELSRAGLYAVVQGRQPPSTNINAGMVTDKYREPAFSSLSEG